MIALQEVGPRMPTLRGYDSYVQDGAGGSTRGMGMYVKQGTAISFEKMGINEGIEYVHYCLLATYG